MDHTHSLIQEMVRTRRSIDSFSLLKLPSLALQHCLLQMDDCDLIDISLLSKRCTRIVGTLPTMPTRMEIHVQPIYQSLNLYRDGDEFFGSQQWNFGSPFPRIERSYDKLKISRNFDGVKVFMRKKPSYYARDRFTGCKFDVGRWKQKGRSKEMGAVIRHLLKIYRNCRIDMHIDFHQLEEDFDFGHLFVQNQPITDLRVSNNSPNSGESMERLLGKVKITGSFRSSTYNLTRTCLSLMTGQRIQIESDRFTEQDILDVVRRWVTVSERRFEIAAIFCTINEELFEEFDKIDLVGETRLINDWMFGNIDLSRGVVVRREDGRCMTIQELRCYVVLVDWSC